MANTLNHLICVWCHARLALEGLRWCRHCLEHWKVHTHLDQLLALACAGQRGLEPAWRIEANWGADSSYGDLL